MSKIKSSAMFTIAALAVVFGVFGATGVGATSHYCGDGKRTDSEQCDNGNQNGVKCTAAYGQTCTYCSATCQSVTVTGPYCGDSAVNGSETCDHGSSNGLACTAAYGQTCSYCSSSCKTVTVAGPYCGDNIKNGNEQCDGTDTPLHYTCDNGCVKHYVPYCGDGIKNGAEQCDGTDGVVNHQKCTDQCMLENVTYCGDNIVNGKEICDGNTKSCEASWGYQGTQSCDRDCDGWNSCTSLEYCGDYIKNGDETCDGDAACVINGYTGTRECKSNCKDWKSGCVASQYCGDHKKNGTEQCDGTDGVGAHQTCDSSCSLVNVPYCGDGTVNQISEACDKGNANGVVPVAGYGETLTYCSATCQNVTVTGPYCGDKIKNGAELCDGTDGISGGQTCSATCQIETPVTPISICGNGKVEGAEVCDGGSQACKTTDNYNGTLDCLDSCAGYSTTCTATEKCGDGTKNGSEGCDDGNTIDGDGCSATCQVEQAHGGSGGDQGGDVTGNGGSGNSDTGNSDTGNTGDTGNAGNDNTGDTGNTGNTGNDTGDTTPAGNNGDANTYVIHVVSRGGGNSSSGDWAPGFGPSASHGRVLGASTERLPLDQVAAAIELIKQIISGLTDQVNAL